MYKFPVGILNEDLALIYFLIIEAGSIAQGTKKHITIFQIQIQYHVLELKRKTFQCFLCMNLLVV